MMQETENYAVALTAETSEMLGTIQSPRKICFVCTGNTCRSPMAAAVLNFLGKGKYDASSAGISPFEDERISQYAVIALEEARIPNNSSNNYKKHTAKLITKKIVGMYDEIVAVTKNHMMRLICAFPEYAQKITVFSEDIPDPYAENLENYKNRLSEITKAVKEKFKL